MSDFTRDLNVRNKAARRVLGLLLLINAVMFLLEMMFGYFAESTALIADSLDMLSDATVYGISLWAVNKSLAKQASAARLSGIFQLLLGIGVAFDITLRVFGSSAPDYRIMIGMGFVALLANTVCLLLIANHREAGVHMRASWIFSRNDVIANAGIILAGSLVLLLGSRWPDLVIGAMIVTVVIRGGIRILQEARKAI